MYNMFRFIVTMTLCISFALFGNFYIGYGAAVWFGLMLYSHHALEADWECIARDNARLTKKNKELQRENKEIRARMAEAMKAQELYLEKTDLLMNKIFNKTPVEMEEMIFGDEEYEEIYSADGIDSP